MWREEKRGQAQRSEKASRGEKLRKEAGGVEVGADKGGQAVKEWRVYTALTPAECVLVGIYHPCCGELGESHLEAAGDLAKPSGDDGGEAEWAED